MRRLLVALTILFAGLVLASCSSQNNGNVIRVGMECDYAPFNWTETTNTESNVAIANVPGSYADGYDVQMAKRIADALGKTLEVYAIEWDGLIPALKNNQIDMIIAGMSPTEKRMQQISFTDGYYVSEEVMLVSATGSYTNATSLADFAGANVAGQLGTIYADLVPQVVEKGAIAGTDLDTVPLLVQAIKGGALDATIVELPVAQGLVAADPSLAYVRFTGTNGFTVSAVDVTVSIGVRKNYSLTSAINAALANISTATRNEIMAAAVAANN